MVRFITMKFWCRKEFRKICGANRNWLQHLPHENHEDKNGKQLRIQ